MKLSETDKKALLKIARLSIADALDERQSVHRQDESPALKEHCGAFVTLHLDNELRGCIGYIEARYPLSDTVEEAAAKAALEDPRFHPLTKEEFEHIEIEISVLSPLQKVLDTTEVEVGTHGLVIDDGRSRGLLLPQVATEYGWGREQFLSQTCRKAGLPADAWKKKGVTIYSFTSDVFSEAELMGKPH